MKINKVLLIYPPTSSVNVTLDYIQMLEPLALEYIAAALPEKDVRILDMRIDHDLKRHLEDFRPDMVGFTGFSCHVNAIVKLAKQVRRNNPDAMIVVGGHHATVRPVDFDLPEVDYIIKGEGTSAIRELLYEGKDNKDILGLCYRNGGARVYNQNRPHPPLDELPFPRRELVGHYVDRYVLNWHYDVATIRTSLGCPFQCSFCSLWELTGSRYLRRDIEQVVAELKSIKSKTLFYADDESMIDYQRMMDLARRIKEEDINKIHYLWARADTVVKHPDLFATWKEIGLEGVFLGYESFKDEELGEYNKKITVETQRQATKILQRLGLIIEANFIITTDYVEKDFENLKRYLRQENLWKASFGILTPWPGCKLYDEKYSSAIEKNWDFYDAGHAVFKTKLPMDQFYQLFNHLERTSMPVRYRLWMLFKEPWRKILRKRWELFAYMWRRNRTYKDQGMH